MAITLKNTAILLNATTTATASGSSVSMGDAWEGFAFSLVAASTGGTTPTFDMKIQHSDDGTTWFDLTTFTQLTADGSELKTVTADVMKFIRYDLTVGGTTPTSDLTLTMSYNDKSVRN